VSVNVSEIRRVAIEIDLSHSADEDNHNLVGITPASVNGNAPVPGDILTLLPARSVSVTMTFGYARAQSLYRLTIESRDSSDKLTGSRPQPGAWAWSH